MTNDERNTHIALCLPIALKLHSMPDGLEFYAYLSAVESLPVRIDLGVFYAIIRPIIRVKSSKKANV